MVANAFEVPSELDGENSAYAPIARMWNEKKDPSRNDRSIASSALDLDDETFGAVLSALDFLSRIHQDAVALDHQEEKAGRVRRQASSILSVATDVSMESWAA